MSPTTIRIVGMFEVTPLPLLALLAGAAAAACDPAGIPLDGGAPAKAPLDGGAPAKVESTLGLVVPDDLAGAAAWVEADPAPASWPVASGGLVEWAGRAPGVATSWLVAQSHW
jgi:hypothetical protein